ncbi:MAG: aminoglycoside 3'-phosphotransferase [Ruminococcaceae bacterium]|nr:aminoglycoside 3'-phosphotransferase [Oscillospiraceae bacterium]
MKKTLLTNIPNDIPSELERLIIGAKIYDSSCSPEARVYYIDKDNGYFLKKSEKDSLKKEAVMTSYFYSKGLGTEVLNYISDTYDWLLTAKVIGEDCTHETYLSDPIKLCDTIATELRKLHELDFSDCPVKNRIQDYLALAETNYKNGTYDKSAFPDSFGYRSADEAIAVLNDGKNELKADVLIHGDYCLPNIMLDNWKISKFIDLGNGGIGDRHIDIFWGIWTLWFNLKTYKYSSRFLDAYGRDKINTDILKIVAAAEVFG